MMLGEEDIPMSRRNSIMAGFRSYTDKVLKKAIEIVNKDKNR